MNVLRSCSFLRVICKFAHSAVYRCRYTVSSTLRSSEKYIALSPD